MAEDGVCVGAAIDLMSGLSSVCLLLVIVLYRFTVYCIRPNPSLVADTSRNLLADTSWSLGHWQGGRAGAGTEWDLMGSGEVCWVNGVTHCAVVRTLLNTFYYY